MNRRSSKPCVAVSVENMEESISKYSTEKATRFFSVLSLSYANRHNLNNYFLCRAVSFGERHLTRDEVEYFHLSTLRLTYDEAVCEYGKRRETRLGRLIANRELPILRKAGEIMNR